jgi:hypothetical protein
MGNLKTRGEKVIHLHWLWRRGAAGTRGVTSGIAVCGANHLPRAEFTCHKDDVTCKTCLTKGSN